MLKEIELLPPLVSECHVIILLNFYGAWVILSTYVGEVPQILLLE